jgi:uncharacterized protein YbcI
MSKTKGQLEAELTKKIVQYEKEYLGRGPLEAKSYLIDDLAIIRLRGVLTPAEEKLIVNHEGRTLVKDARRQLFETSREILEEIVEDVLDLEMESLFSDICLQSSERVIILTFSNSRNK